MLPKTASGSAPSGSSAAAISSSERAARSSRAAANGSVAAASNTSGASSRVGVLPRSIAPAQQRVARRARQRADRPGQRPTPARPSIGAMCLAHRAQAQPCAAAFVADGKSPAADGRAQAVAAQRFADAAGAGSDDRAGPSCVCAEQDRVRVGVERDLRKRRCAPQKLFITLPHVRAGETEAKRASLARCGREPRVGERAVDRLPDVFPRLLDPLAERGRAGHGKAQHGAVRGESRARVCVPPPSTPMR